MKKYSTTIIQILIAFVFGNAFYYYEEGIKSFDYYSVPGEIFFLVFISLIFAVLPIIISNVWKKSLVVSLLGFIPVLGFLVFIMSTNA